MKKTIIIIAALALASLSYGKNVKSQLEEMATFANKQTPIIMGNGMTWIIDSIQYDKNKNLYSYYYSSLLIYDDVLSSSLKGMDEETLKQQICSTIPEDDPATKLFKKAGTNLRYQYKKSTGEVIRTLIIENHMISKKLTAEEEKARDKQLMIEIARNTNAQCPLTIDMYTVMISCNYDDQNYILTYNYDVTTDNENILTEDFESRMKNVLSKNVQKGISLLIFKRNNVTFKYKYKFNGKEIREVVIMPIDYK